MTKLSKGIKKVIVFKEGQEPKEVEDKKEISKILERIPDKTEWEKRLESYKKRRGK